MAEYLIKKETLDAMAEQTNALSGKTDAVSPSTMISDLTEVNEDVTTLSSMIKEAIYTTPDILMRCLIERTNEVPITIDERFHIEKIGNNAFRNCSSLTTVDFPAATSIGHGAFAYCSSLTTVYFPAVTSIEDNAFEGCSSLTTVDLPAATSIEDNAFAYCSSLTTVILRNTKTVCCIENSYDPFVTTPLYSGTGYIYVPSALIESYKTDRYWSRYASRFRALEEYIDVVGGVV